MPFDNGGWDAVIEASTVGDLPALQDLLSGRVVKAAKIVNAADRAQRTALSWACTYGHTACVKLLLARGADVNLADMFGYTALHEACSFGHIAIARLLLNHKADPNASTKLGETPLHSACSKGRGACVTLLLQFRAMQNRTSQTGGMPIHVACYFNKAVCVEALLKGGGAPDIHNAEHATWQGRTAWDICNDRGLKALKESLPGAERQQREWEERRREEKEKAIAYRKELERALLGKKGNGKK